MLKDILMFYFRVVIKKLTLCHMGHNLNEGSVLDWWGVESYEFR